MSRTKLARRREGAKERQKAEKAARQALLAQPSSAQPPPAAPAEGALDQQNARAAHKAARRAKKRSAAGFDLALVSDSCAGLVLRAAAAAEDDFADVVCGTKRQAAAVSQLAALYGVCVTRLGARCDGGSEVLRLRRSAYRPASLPAGEREVRLAKLLAAAGSRGWEEEGVATPSEKKRKRAAQKPAAAKALAPAVAVAAAVATEPPAIKAVPWVICRS